VLETNAIVIVVVIVSFSNRVFIWISLFIRI
jgi:hypothetical protein